jgi:hypothetical protein
LVLTAELDDGSIELKMTGPLGTAELLDTLIRA